MLQMRELRIGQKSRRHRESGTLGNLWESRNTERPSDPDGTSDNAGRQVGQTGQLARPAGQNHATARFRREGRCRQPVTHQFEDFLSARFDDPVESRP